MAEVPPPYRKRLMSLGIEAAAAGDAEADIQLRRGGTTQDYRCKVSAGVRFADVARAGQATPPLLVLTTFVPPKTADSLRRAQIQYLDQAGNAWIEFGDVLIDVRGRPRPPGLDAPRRPVTNLFSTARAQVVLVLLTWPELWEAPRRDLSRAAGVSLGQAHATVTLLAELGYHHDPPRPARAELLDLWTASFPTGLARRLALGTFHGEVEAVKAADAESRVFLSGERAAADLLRPSTLTIYVDDLDPRLPIVNRWRADGPPNITVRRKFWRAPGGQDDSAPRVTVAPWPLVYADLVSSNDPRVNAAATEWRNRFA